MPIKVKLNSYKSLVQPILEYVSVVWASVVWAPCMQLNINKVEIIQRQAAIFIYNDFSWNSSVSNILRQLDLPMLTYRRDKADKARNIIHKLVDITPSESYLIPNSRDKRGHPLKFTQLPTSIDAYKHSFSHNHKLAIYVCACDYALLFMIVILCVYFHICAVIMQVAT